MISRPRRHAAKALADDPPQFITEGGLFKQGYNAELDELLDLVEHGENRVKALLDEEQKASGISKLKLGYNRVFGYYFELSKAVGGTPPEHFIRRQTLANAERFTTVRLKELEEKVGFAARYRRVQQTLEELEQLVIDARFECTGPNARLTTTEYAATLNKMLGLIRSIDEVNES